MYEWQTKIEWPWIRDLNEKISEHKYKNIKNGEYGPRMGYFQDENVNVANAVLIKSVYNICVPTINI